jgi:hypothetical protein
VCARACHGRNGGMAGQDQCRAVEVGARSFKQGGGWGLYGILSAPVCACVRACVRVCLCAREGGKDGHLTGHALEEVASSGCVRARARACACVCEGCAPP